VKSTIRQIHFDEAVTALKILTRELGHPLAHHSERNASISSWLQHPLTIPLFGDKELRDKWVARLFEQSYPALGRRRESTKLVDGRHELFILYERIPFPPTSVGSFRFIDLFAGIGGFRLALQSVGGQCVFSSEWDKSAKETYYRNFGEFPFGDINIFSGEHLADDQVRDFIPNHDILCAGFPCQPFSRAGVSARNSIGLKHGFACETQGTLFFNIVRVAAVKKPAVMILENVKNLVLHDKGKTFSVIEQTVRDLGYSFSYKIINAKTVVPQNRARCFMVALHGEKEFDIPEFKGNPLPLRSILEPEPPRSYTISRRLWLGHQRRTERNLARGTGFTAHTAILDKPSNTLVARYGKDGKECLIPQKGKNPRKLTPRECARLLGFPEEFRLPDTDTPAYKQFGNSVVVPVVTKIAKLLAARFGKSLAGRKLSPK